MSGSRPPYPWAFLAGGAAFALYAFTLAPTTGFWDASEYIATAHIVGIPHPPGNPLFVVLGRVWILLLAPLGLPVAVRVNLFAATTTAISVGFLFLIAHRALTGILVGRTVCLVGAFVSVLIGATAYTVWTQSTVNEKVYTVSLAVIAAASWLVIRARDLGHGPRSQRSLLTAGYLLVLGSTNHLMSVLPGPAIVVFLAVAGMAALRSRAFWARAAMLVVVGLSFNLVLPIRAAQDPVINEADPSCETLGSAVVAVYTFGRTGCGPLAAALTRQQYQKPALSERQAPLRAQLLNYLQYFDWQWGRSLDASETPGGGRTGATLLFLALGVAGLWSIWSTDRAIFAYLATLLATLTGGLVYYLNFKYGYSIYPEIADPLLHEVRERDYFFVASFALWGVLAGVGLATLWRLAAERIGGARGYVLAAPVLMVALLPLALNARWADRSGIFAARDWAYDLLMGVEPYGVLFTNGDNDTFPLWYLQEVEGIRDDVTVVVVQYLYTDWYPRQLQELTSSARQRAFRSPVPDLYPEPDRAPAHPIIRTEPDVMDRVTGGAFGEDFTVPLGSVAVTYPARTYLDRAQQLVLTIIHDSIGERPVYFASTTGFMSGLGIEDWGVRQGLASKLLPRAPTDPLPEGVVKIDESYGGEWFDVPRTRKLVEDVFRYRGLADVDVWADRSTLNIPWHFYVLHVQLADGLLQTGAPERGVAVQALLERADGFLRTARGGRLGTPGA